MRITKDDVGMGILLMVFVGIALAVYSYQTHKNSTTIPKLFYVGVSMAGVPVAAWLLYLFAITSNNVTRFYGT